MTIYKHQSSYRAEVWIGRTRIARRTFRKKTDAKAWHDQTRAKLLAGEAIEQDRKTKFSQLLTEYRSTFLRPGKLTTGTISRYSQDIDTHIEEFFGHIPLVNISAFLIETFQGHLLDKGLSPKSVNHVTDTLRMIMKKAVEWELVRFTWRLKKLRIPKSDYLWWDDRSDIDRFLEVAQKHSRWYRYYLVALETGMRLSEIAGLHKSDIDFRFGRIHVQRQYSDAEKKMIPPKGQRPRWIDFDPASTLGRELASAIKCSSDSRLLFPSERLGPAPTDKISQKYMHLLIDRAGVPRIKFHDLRHTFASWYMIEVGDIWALQQILGHADISTTMKYAHMSAQHRRTPLDLSAKLPSGLDTSRVKMIKATQ